jgi:hypothetical protein
MVYEMMLQEIARKTRVSLMALRKTGAELYDRTAVRMHLFVGPMCWINAIGEEEV